MSLGQVSKIERGKTGDNATAGAGCDFTGVVPTVLAGKGRFEQRLEGGEEVSPVDIWDNSVPAS